MENNNENKTSPDFVDSKIGDIPTPENTDAPTPNGAPNIAPGFAQNGMPQPPHFPQAEGIDPFARPQPAYLPYFGPVPPFAPAPEKKNKRRIWPFVLIGVIFAVVLLFVGVVILAANLSQEASGHASALPSDGSEYVAVFYIDSEISGDYVTASIYGASSSYDQAFYLDTIDALINDTANVGIMLYINSPGGEVTTTDEFARAIDKYKDHTSRPVYAYFSDLAASGAYWIGSHADKIIASKFCTTGSIGVTYGTHIEISGLLDKLGITVTELIAGDNKAMGSLYSPLTEEQKQMYESQLREMHEMFIEVVATNRNLDKESVRAIADGRTFLASSALEYGLIDAIGYFDDAKKAMTEENSLGENVIFHDCLPEFNSSSNPLLSLIESNTDDKSALTEDDLAALIEELNHSRRFMALYR